MRSINNRLMCLSLSLTIVIACFSRVDALNLGVSRLQTNFMRKWSTRRKLSHSTLSIPPKKNDAKQRLKLKKCSSQTGQASQLGQSSSKYMDYLDNLSGKKFRSYRKQIKILAENNTTDPLTNAMDNMLTRISSKQMVADVRRRRRCYLSDWTDAFKKKRQVIPAILFLYFACLSPAVSFGTIASEITNGSIGIVEFLLSSGLSGMAYSVLCGQPMSFVAPTGLTLAFISGLFSFCSIKNVPFFPVYSWVGLWTSLYMIMLGLSGSSKWIRYCTRFTDEIFNGLLSLNFIYEGFLSLRRNFVLADPMNLTMPFVALGMALSTFWGYMTVTAFQASKFFNQKVRNAIKDFGPVTVFVLMSIFNLHPWCRKFGVPTLSVPSHFQLAGGRKFLIPILSVSWKVKLLCSFPALLLTSLFFMDQNISVRIVNSPDNKLKKGDAYNLDMFALGLITGAVSLVGLPWMCGATVQSMNHVRAMTEKAFNEETGEVEIVDVTETRTTGFVIHAMIASTVCLLPLLRFVPIPVVSGVFLFLGRKLMTGNSFLSRIRDSIAEKNRLPEHHPIQVMNRLKMNIFTLVQVMCLVGLWSFKNNPTMAIFFPSVIGLLMVIRSFMLPKFFSEKELEILGDPTPS
mmetsp:Transcript_11189/g.12477  ORF Transcript_11189/g.12477 Transcript_11189/m.12477 type:complete len:629 (-) Transcript_11189:122-2008(-)